jgi:hypothetical protein
LKKEGQREKRWKRFKIALLAPVPVKSWRPAGSSASPCPPSPQPYLCASKLNSRLLMRKFLHLRKTLTQGGAGNVTVSYGDALRKYVVIAVMGEAGSGKSTIIRLMADDEDAQGRNVYARVQNLFADAITISNIT